MPDPLDIPFAAAEGLSTYWYQATAAFGGQVLDANYNPQFTSPSSAGYKAMQWMVNAYKTGLVPKANIGVTDYQGFTSEMAQGRVASVFSDYAGTVGSIYDVPSSSKVVGQVQYIPTPGVSGAAPNLANPDGIGIPTTAKNVAGALAFIKWFTDTQQQAIWAGLDGSADVISGFPLPARVSSLQLLASGKVAGASELTVAAQDLARRVPRPRGAALVLAVQQLRLHQHPSGRRGGADRAAGGDQHRHTRSTSSSRASNDHERRRRDRGQRNDAGGVAAGSLS